MNKAINNKRLARGGTQTNKNIFPPVTKQMKPTDIKSRLMKIVGKEEKVKKRNLPPSCTGRKRRQRERRIGREDGRRRGGVGVGGGDGQKRERERDVTKRTTKLMAVVNVVVSRWWWW